MSLVNYKEGKKMSEEEKKLSWTVQELIDELKTCDPKAYVLIQPILLEPELEAIDSIREAQIFEDNFTFPRYPRLLYPEEKGRGKKHKIVIIEID